MNFRRLCNSELHKPSRGRWSLSGLSQLILKPVMAISVPIDKGVVVFFRSPLLLKNLILRQLRSILPVAITSGTAAYLCFVPAVIWRSWDVISRRCYQPVRMLLTRCREILISCVWMRWPLPLALPILSTTQCWRRPIGRW